MKKAPNTKNIVQKLGTVSTVRVLFGFIWLIDAFFKWQPAFQKGYLDILINAAKNQPAVLKPWFDFWIVLVSSQRQLFIYSTAIVETYIALAILFGFSKRFTYLLAIVFSLLIWSTAEGFGGPYTAGSTDVGTAIIYALIALLLLITDKKR